MPTVEVEGVQGGIGVDGGVRIYMPGAGPIPIEQVWHFDAERDIILRVWTDEEWGRLNPADRPPQAQPLKGIGWSLLSERPTVNGPAAG